MWTCAHAESALLGLSETQTHFMSKSHEGMKRLQTHIQLGADRVSSCAVMLLSFFFLRVYIFPFLFFERVTFSLGNTCWQLNYDKYVCVGAQLGLHLFNNILFLLNMSLWSALA